MKTKMLLPKYIKLSNSICLIRVDKSNEYYRHAGRWFIKVKETTEGLKTISDHKSLNGLTVSKTTKHSWKIDNGEYIDNNKKGV